MINQSVTEGVYYPNGLQSNFTRQESRISFATRVAQWRNLSVQTGLIESPNPERFHTPEREKQNIIKTSLLLVSSIAGE
ncbi:hypothetical protein VNO78_22298 [Psophocarpus tetragonolobus]|uniref:Uncharacterized protein n=1 Tax=Psophocarpus tetragonolobus TaxID=3891 RepID=A0AAN9SE64_PSOTE